MPEGSPTGFLTETFHKDDGALLELLQKRSVSRGAIERRKHTYYQNSELCKYFVKMQASLTVHAL